MASKEPSICEGVLPPIQLSTRAVAPGWTNCTTSVEPTLNEPQLSTLLLPAVTVVVFWFVAIVALPATTVPPVGGARKTEVANTRAKKPRPNRDFRASERCETKPMDPTEKCARFIVIVLFLRSIREGTNQVGLFVALGHHDLLARYDGVVAQLLQCRAEVAAN